MKKNDKGETFYHVTISSHGVKKHNLWLSKPEVKSRLSKILNPYDEVTAVSKEEDDAKKKEIHKKAAGFKKHVVSEDDINDIEYYDYDTSKYRKIHNFGDDVHNLPDGKSKQIGFNYKTNDGRRVHISIKVTKNGNENAFEIKNGSANGTLKFSINNQGGFQGQQKDLRSKIKQSIESRVNSDIVKKIK